MYVIMECRLSKVERRKNYNEYGPTKQQPCKPFLHLQERFCRRADWNLPWDIQIQGLSVEQAATEQEWQARRNPIFYARHVIRAPNDDWTQWDMCTQALNEFELGNILGWFHGNSKHEYIIYTSNSWKHSKSNRLPLSVCAKAQGPMQAPFSFHASSWLLPRISWASHWWTWQPLGFWRHPTPSLLDVKVLSLYQHRSQVPRRGLNRQECPDETETLKTSHHHHYHHPAMCASFKS